MRQNTYEDITIGGGSIVIIQKSHQLQANSFYQANIAKLPPFTAL